MAEGVVTTGRSAIDRLRFAGWTAGFGLLLLLACAPSDQRAQLHGAVALLAVLVLCQALGRRARTMRSRRIARLVLILVCTFLSLRYMQWRASDTLPLQFGPVAMACGLLLFLAEAYGFVNMLLGFFINAEPFFRRSIPLPDDSSGALPHVDVYIPTYNEDVAIVRPTLIAATQMRYPAHKLHIHVLDDGGTVQKCTDSDPEKAAAARERAAALRALAERYGATYLTRERNLHAKAGNLNSALAHTRGELLLVLDCDHIPAGDFLQRTVGFFLADPKLFVLQTPHNFVSPDPLERNLDTHDESPNENELFYDVMQPGLDFWGASFFCGSAAILRRAVVDRLGGVSGQTITEDAETTLDALSLGYRSAYYNRPMVSGLQPETYAGFVVQRVRWGQGMLQIFLLKNPWRQPGLTLTQRLLYTNFAFFWGFAFARLVMLLAPPMYLVFGITLCDATTEQLLLYAGPALVASLVSTQFFYGRVRWPFVSQLYEVVQSVYVIKGLWQVLRSPRSPSFKVTPKGEVLDRDFVSSLSVPFYVLLTFNALALLAGCWRLGGVPLNTGAIVFVMFWAVLDLVMLLAALGVTFERRQLRAEPRAPCREPVTLRFGGVPYAGVARDASASGLGIVLSLPAGSGLGDEALQHTVDLAFPGRGVLPARVVGCRALGAGQWRVGLQYAFASIEQERLAIDLAFGSSEVLVANNRRRHAGRSHWGGFVRLLGAAWHFGLGHLVFLIDHRPQARGAPPHRSGIR